MPGRNGNSLVMPFAQNHGVSRPVIAAKPQLVRPRIAPAVIIPKVNVPTIQPKFAPVPKLGDRPQATHGKPGPSAGNRSENRSQAAKPGAAPMPPKILAVSQIGQNDPVVQAKAGSGQPKFYPNLNPAAAALKIDPAEFMRLEGSFDSSNYRMRRGGDHGLLVPNSKFIFVRTMDGETVMHQRYRHPVLAQGKPVLYAGEAYFNNGKLDWWSNGSGNYRPDSDHAEQAALPMERFFTYEQVLKGANKK